jgi:hypothetical protein
MVDSSQIFEYDATNFSLGLGASSVEKTVRVSALSRFTNLEQKFTDKDAASTPDGVGNTTLVRDNLHCPFPPMSSFRF